MISKALLNYLIILSLKTLAFPSISLRRVESVTVKSPQILPAAKNAVPRSLRMLDSSTIYEIQTWAGNVASQELKHASPLSAAVMYGTGFLMSLSPCALSLLPLTLAYIAGFDDGDDGKGTLVPSLSFAAGLAAVLSLLGLSASYAGKVFGSSSIGDGTLLPLVSSVVAIVAGMKLLDLVNISLPSFEVGVDTIERLPPSVRAFVLGASSALIASPCCTPVLAAILSFAASNQDPLLGFLLLLAYSAGYTTLLVIAGAAGGALNQIMKVGNLSWISSASAALLIFYGTYSGLDAIYTLL